MFGILLDLTDIHNLLNKYEKIMLSLIRIKLSYSCKNRNRRVTVMKIKKKKKDGWQMVVTFIMQRPNMYIF